MVSLARFDLAIVIAVANAGPEAFEKSEAQRIRRIRAMKSILRQVERSVTA